MGKSINKYNSKLTQDVWSTRFIYFFFFSLPAVSKFYCNNDPSSVLDGGARLAGSNTLPLSLPCTPRETFERGKRTAQSETRDGDKLFVREQETAEGIVQMSWNYFRRRLTLSIKNSEYKIIKMLRLTIFVFFLFRPGSRKEGSVGQQSLASLIPLSRFVNYNMPTEFLRFKRLTAYRSSFSPLSLADGVESKPVSINKSILSPSCTFCHWSFWRSFQWSLFVLRLPPDTFWQSQKKERSRQKKQFPKRYEQVMFWLKTFEFYASI